MAPFAHFQNKVRSGMSSAGDFHITADKTNDNDMIMISYVIKTYHCKTTRHINNLKGRDVKLIKVCIVYVDNVLASRL